MGASLAIFLHEAGLYETKMRLRNVGKCGWYEKVPTKGIGYPIEDN
jgi:hypothetical protein